MAAIGYHFDATPLHRNLHRRFTIHMEVQLSILIDRLIGPDLE
jgi:hypothetical protein